MDEDYLAEEVEEDLLLCLQTKPEVDPAEKRKADALLQGRDVRAKLLAYLPAPLQSKEDLSKAT